MSRRLSIAIAVVLALLIAAVVVERAAPPLPSVEPTPPSPDPRASVPTKPSLPAAIGATSTPAIAPTPMSAGAVELSPATPAAAAPSAMNLAAAAAGEYRRRAQYPPWSLPVDASGDDPIRRDYDVTPNFARGPNGEDPTLVVFPDQVGFEAPDPVVWHAYLSVDGKPVAPARLEGEIRDAHGAVIGQLRFSDEGRDGDAEIGDAIFSAAVDGANAIALDGAYAVRVHAVARDGEERFGTSGFLYSHPDAQLTGRYSDRVVDGNLQIVAEVEVAKTGRFHLAATLYTQDGQPLAWAQNALHLEPGVHTLPLNFYGRILRQKQANGPYLLRFVALSTTTAMPNARNRLVENAYVTQVYDVAAFSDAPFNDPNLLDTANRLEGGTRP